LYICIIWFLISSLSLGDRSAHKLGEDLINKLCIKLANKTFIMNSTVTINVVEFQRHKKCRKNISQIEGFIPSKDRINANDYFGSARKGAATACSNAPVQDLSDDVRVLNDAFLNQVYYTASNGKLTASAGGLMERILL
jgi:hypothetical protein